MKKVFADWRNQETYPPVKSTPPERWKWEFIRRNPSYQKLYSEFKSYGPKREKQIIKDYEKLDKLNKDDRKIKENRLDQKRKKEDKNYYNSILSRLCYFGIDADFVIDPSKVPHHLDLFMKESPYVDPPHIIGAGGERINQELYYKETHVILLFDISSSIPEQAERARKLLNEHLDREKIKAERNGKNYIFGKKSQPQPVKLQRYLRLLDAQTEGATRKQMAQIIFGEKEYHNYVIQNVYDNISKAEYYRDKGFLEIC